MCNKSLSRSYNLTCFATSARVQGSLIGGRGREEEVGCCFQSVRDRMEMWPSPAIDDGDEMGCRCDEEKCLV